MSNDRTRLPPGSQPYDPLNGFRIGALAGGLLGAVAAWAFGSYAVWIVIFCAAGGGVVGYWSERRRSRR